MYLGINEVKFTRIRMLQKIVVQGSMHLFMAFFPSFPRCVCVQVRSAQVQWHEAKKMLKKDYRWDLTKPLGHDEKEQYFQDHVLQLREKKRLQFRKLLFDAAEVSEQCCFFFFCNLQSNYDWCTLHEGSTNSSN